MKSMNKGLAILAVLTFLVGSMLTGCQSTPTPATTTPPASAATEASQPAATTEATAEPAPAAADLPYVKLTFDLPQPIQKDQQMVNDAISKVLKAKYNCDLNINGIDWAQWEQQKQLVLSSGEPVDMIYDANFLGFTADVGNNSFLPLDDLLQKYGQDIISLSLDGYLKSAKVNGVTYGINCNKDQTQDMGFFLVQSMFDKLGIDESSLSNIKYLEDMEPLLATAKEKLPAGTWPIYVSVANAPNFNWLIGATKAGQEAGLYDQKTCYIFLDDYVVLNYSTGDVTPVYDIPAFVDFCKLTRSWFQNGYINSDAATTQVVWADAWIANKALMSVATQTPMHYGFAMNAMAGTDVKVVKTPINLKPGVIASGLFGGPCLPRSCPNPERSIMVLNEFYKNAEIENMFVHGIENVHYTKISDNVVKKTAGSNYNPGSFWEMGNWYVGPNKSIMTTDIEDPATYQNLMAFNNKAFKTPLIGYNFDTSSVKNQVAAHRNVTSKYIGILVNGVVDPDTTIAKMKAEDKAAGIDQICAAYSSQYKAFVGK